MNTEKEAKFKKYAPILILVIIIVVGLVILGATYFVQYLWNSTLPDLFGFKEITYWQTFRLFLLISIFFGGSRTVSEGGKSVKKNTSQYVFSRDSE